MNAMNRSTCGRNGLCDCVCVCHVVAVVCSAVVCTTKCRFDKKKRWTNKELLTTERISDVFESVCSSNTCRTPRIRLQAITCKNAYTDLYICHSNAPSCCVWCELTISECPAAEPLLRVNSCRKLNYFAIARRRFISRRICKQRNDENQFRSAIAWFIAFAQFLCIIFVFAQSVLGPWLARLMKFNLIEMGMGCALLGF